MPCCKESTKSFPRMFTSPGCPPRPENLFYALLTLQDKIDTMTLAKKADRSPLRSKHGGEFQAPGNDRADNANQNSCQPSAIRCEPNNSCGGQPPRLSGRANSASYQVQEPCRTSPNSPSNPNSPPSMKPKNSPVAARPSAIANVNGTYSAMDKRLPTPRRPARRRHSRERQSRLPLARLGVRSRRPVRPVHNANAEARGVSLKIENGDVLIEI